MMKEGGSTEETRLTTGFRLLLTRPPLPAELKVLHAAYERARVDFTKDVEAAKSLLAVGSAGYDVKLNLAELAAYTTVASTLLNLDEAVTKQ